MPFIKRDGRGCGAVVSSGKMGVRIPAATDLSR